MTSRRMTSREETNKRSMGFGAAEVLGRSGPGWLFAGEAAFEAARVSRSARPEGKIQDGKIRDGMIKDGLVCDGMILAFTLLLLFLVSMMGVYVLTSASTEVSISGHNRVGREAFNAADASARISVLLGRILLHPELGPPEDVLTTGTGPALRFEVEINEDRFSLSQLQSEASKFDFTARYSQALSLSDDPDKRPHLIFKVDDKVVSSTVMSLESFNPVDPGSSLSASDAYDGGGGSNVRVNLVVTVNGASASTSFESDAGYEPRSVITSIYREYM